MIMIITIMKMMIATSPPTEGTAQHKHNSKEENTGAIQHVPNANQIYKRALSVITFCLNLT